MKHFLSLPLSQAAQALNIDWAQLDQELQLVYKKQPDGEDYVFAGEYFPDDDGVAEDEEAIILPVSSVYAGTEDWDAGADFANIIGSTGDDPKDNKGKGSSWKKLAEAAGISWECNAEKDHFYDQFTGQLVTVPARHYVCNQDRLKPGDRLNMIGGHVLAGTTPGRVTPGSTVRVIPLCKHHNSLAVNHGGRTPGNGNGFYMRTKFDTKMLLMNSYMPNSQVQKYLVKE